jgi:hypothetical protein
MATIDLDARRAARAEHANAPHEATLGGRVYRFKPRMPLEFTDLLSAGRMGEAMALLLVDPDDWQAMRAAVPDEDDLMAIAELYGVDLGEAPASAPSSRRTGPTSKRTSKRTTDSILAA